MACAEASSPLPPIESRSCTAGAQQASQWQGWPRHLVALGQFELLKADSLHHLGDGGDRGIVLKANSCQQFVANLSVCGLRRLRECLNPEGPSKG